MRSNPIRRVVRSVGERDPLLLAHHPSCEYYAHHTVELYGQRVCMGCVVVYPVGFCSLFALAIGRLLVPGLPVYELDTVALYALGFGLVLPMVLAKAWPGTRSGRARVAGKALLAVGLAFVALPFLFRPTARLTTAVLFVGFLAPYVGYKALTATDDCEGCPEADDFPRCSGMSFDNTYVYDDRSGEG
jgi:hypothetical protein